MGNVLLALLKYASQHLYHYHYHNHIKRSPLLTCQIFGMLVHVSAADEMYLALNRHNITISIQMQLSRKANNFLKYLLHFLDLDQILNFLKQNISLIDFVFPELRTDSENVVRQKTKKPRLRERFDKQHGERAKALLKPAVLHLYEIY